MFVKNSRLNGMLNSFYFFLKRQFTKTENTDDKNTK